MKKVIFQYLFIFLILILVFIFLLILASSFSSDKMENNVKISSEILLTEGNRKIVYIPYKTINLEFDNYSDSLMINTAYSIDKSTPLYSALMARKNYIPNVTTKVYQDSAGELQSSSKYEVLDQVGELNDLINGEKLESFEYARYWHGYLVVLRPLLVLLNLSQIRILFTILLLILAIIMIYLVYKKIGLIVAFIFLMGLWSIEYFYLSFSLHEIFLFFIMMLSSIIMLLRYDKMKNFGFLFLVIGMLTNFFDLLSVPIVTLGIPLVLYVLLNQKRKIDIHIILKDIVKFTLLWGIGYGFTWLTKWLLVDILYHRNLISVALKQVLYRSTNIGNVSILDIINTNLFYIIVPLFISNMSIWLIYFCKNILSKKIKTIEVNKKEKYMNMLPYVMIGIIPIVWYMVLKNHSYYHSFFVYRDLIITNICLNLIVAKIFSANNF